ncbi:hypothetical protein H1D44_20240 [Halomonas kenyensis]|uniref:Helix-turn-helix domain-containing protein n=1 Tax=Billgrantia kenyensis TaxID=321266 RepID=A0A7V9W541_9GAMM|nr:hypothetical protein [Halomonas kenyensis]MCG6663889.1 hypothetical protein [Halomonas kenyensis]
MSQRHTGRELGIYRSTINRELRRNASTGAYDPEEAQSLRSPAPSCLEMDEALVGHDCLRCRPTA